MKKKIWLERRNGGSIPSLIDKILLCVSSHFCPFTKANLVLVNFDKNPLTKQMAKIAKMAIRPNAIVRNVRNKMEHDSKWYKFGSLTLCYKPLSNVQ